jgi:RND family efflux transporter MFP subunit
MTISGQIEPYAVATVSSEVAARVTARPPDRGSHVSTGDLLAALDDASARATLDQALAALAQATAARRQLEEEYRRATQETAAAQDQARAQVAQATAGERKARSFTRAQEQRQAEAALAQAQTDEHLAQIEADRYRRLVEAGAVAQQTLDRAQATYDAAVARRESAEQAASLAKEGARQEDIAAAAAQAAAARAALRGAEARPARLAALREQIAGLRAQEGEAAAAVRAARIALGKHHITAPFPGRVLETRIEAGEMAAPGAPVMKIGDIRQVKATFAVPEASRSALQEGQKVSLTADILAGRTFTGRVRVLGYEADSHARTFPVEVTVANPGERLLPGMVVRLHLNAPAQPHYALVPVASVAADGSGSYVFVLHGDRATRRPVTLGAPVGSAAVEITGGLTAGETIAATPQRLTDGARVHIDADGGDAR